MKVMKFGGASLGSPDIIRQVKQIIQDQNEVIVVVVSAFEGITDALLELSRHAASKDRKFFRLYSAIENKHLEIINGVFCEPVKLQITKQAQAYLQELSDIVQGVYLLNDLTPKTQDKIISYGELLSSYILSRFLDDCELVDVRALIKTDSRFGKAKVNLPLTTRLLRAQFKNLKRTVVVPGFIASNDRNETTTLGRGGSDYTAALISAALEVQELEIWSHVDGFMTADPQKVRKALAIDCLSYAEAMELSHFGAEVIYTPTIHPVYRKNIRVRIRNTFNPLAEGTLISSESCSKLNSPIKGISSIDDINLITLQGPGMVGVKGISSRLFGALAQADVNIILITQASSEYSITFALSPTDAPHAMKSIEKEFETEIKLRAELNMLIEKDLSVIAIVGEKMKNTPGISANLFNSLGRNGISVIATAQGSSELNISVVIRKDSLHKALNVIHEGFFLSHNKELHLYLVGTGTVGGNLLKQIRNQQDVLLADHHLKLNVVGICRSKLMMLNPDGINLETFRDDLEWQGEKSDINLFIQKMQFLNLRNSVFIDCTADVTVAGTYAQVMQSFISVVTANKIACSGKLEHYQHLKNTARQKNVKFMFETNVGAGLPIISTLNDLIRSGDRIVRLEAVLSGTLNFIFNSLSEEIHLSRAVHMAMEKGFAEPDPRIDLSGIDVRRKLLILARESGYAWESEEIEVVPFLPESCFAGDLADFWKQIEVFDAVFEERRRKLVNENKRLRFVARLQDGKGKIELEEVPLTHPAYPLEGSNNIILITTLRYHEQPMVIRGYGAGAEVTAAGVFADIIRVANV